jgi:hypothetical protein
MNSFELKKEQSFILADKVKQRNIRKIIKTEGHSNECNGACVDDSKVTHYH